MPKLSSVSYKKLLKVFEADGFRCVREEGDHMVFTKPGVVRPVVIPKYSSVPVFIIKNNQPVKFWWWYNREDQYSMLVLIGISFFGGVISTKRLSLTGAA